MRFESSRHRAIVAVVDATHHWIVWDSECSICRRSVHWALAHDTHDQLRAIPYQEVPTPPLTPALREACRAAVHVRTTDGRWLRGGRACLFVLERFLDSHAITVVQSAVLSALGPGFCAEYVLLRGASA